jgi:DNA polymerase-3 subunit beta
VIPTDNDKVLEVNTQQFREAVDRVSAISAERSRAVKMALSNGNLTLSVSSPDNDTAIEEIPVAYDAGNIEIGFNARYLLDIAQQIDGDEARFNLADAASPTLVQDKDDASALYVLMPMRV